MDEVWAEGYAEGYADGMLDRPSRLDSQVLPEATIIAGAASPEPKEGK